MHGPGGNRVSKMTIDEYIKWQRWDEWPERADNLQQKFQRVTGDAIYRRKIIYNIDAQIIV